MIADVGFWGLVQAFFLSIFLAVVPLWGSFRNNQGLMQWARPLAYGQCLCLLVSFFALAIAFVQNDFSVAYIVQNSNTHLPLIYRFCAVWGAHEGSMLLWVLVLSLWMAAVAQFSRSLPAPVVARVLSVLGMVSFGFLLFILMTSNPFTRLLPWVPQDGRDLNPILQDPGLVIHPPMLYMGYVGFSVAFAFAMTGLISGRLDAEWVRWTRPWTNAAWSFLTLGIVLGSWWSYHQLGWGGWWFWDPVENASFLPWLVGAALMHCLAVCEKRQAFRRWTVLLAIFAFSLSLLGTFLVRSGVLNSVHSFANDPARGVFILRFVSIVISASLLLYAWRSQRLQSEEGFAFCSRETFLLCNNVILFVSMATILLGTLYPLALEYWGLGKISVGMPYYNTVFVPMMIPLLVLMGIGPLTRWREMSGRLLWQRLRVIFAVSLLLGITLPWILKFEWRWGVSLGIVLAVWVAGTALETLRLKGWRGIFASQYGMALAHVGVAVCVIGVVMATAFSVQRDLEMSVGDQAKLSGYSFTLKSVEPLSGPNFDGVVGIFAIQQGDHHFLPLRAERRHYQVANLLKAQAAIHSGIFRDLYVVLGEPLGGDRWGVRLYFKPFVRWIWAGGWLMLIGAALSIFDRRYYRRKAD